MEVNKDKFILDMTCGGRSIWFNKQHPNCVYFDRREEDYTQVFETDSGERHIRVHPDVKGDFRNLPFDDESFDLVVFDPPHIVSTNGGTGWMTKAYSFYHTKEEAKASVAGGFKEGMRVLKQHGVLIFKWAETAIPTSEIITSFGIEPLFGHRSGKKLGTNWLCFMKIEPMQTKMF